MYAPSRACVNRCLFSAGFRIYNVKTPKEKKEGGGGGMIEEIRR